MKRLKKGQRIGKEADNETPVELAEALRGTMNVQDTCIHLGVSYGHVIIVGRKI